MVQISHAGLRRVLESLGGPGLLFTEMLDARKVTRENFKDNPWIVKTGKIPVFHQILAWNPEVAQNAVMRLKEWGTDGVDINMGCPAPNIRQLTGGIMLMREHDLTRRILEAVRSVYAGPLTAKIRIGFEEDADYLLGFARLLESSGVDAVTLHPRLANQKLKSRSKWAYLTLLKQHLRIPVIGNGDLITTEDVRDALRDYPLDGYMLSRASATTPWIFRQIRDSLDAPDSLPSTRPSLPGIWLEFFEWTAGYFKEAEARERIGKWTYYFSKNFLFGHHLWTQVQNAPTLAKARETALSFFSRQGDS